MKQFVSSADMLSYLQYLLTDFMEEKEKYGPDDRIVNRKMHDMIACKNMVEGLLSVPVNLQIDGKVTTGF